MPKSGLGFVTGLTFQSEQFRRQCSRMPSEGFSANTCSCAAFLHHWPGGRQDLPRLARNPPANPALASQNRVTEGEHSCPKTPVYCDNLRRGWSRIRPALASYRHHRRRIMGRGAEFPVSLSAVIAQTKASARSSPASFCPTPIAISWSSSAEKTPQWWTRPCW
jgi:hypothetical protein